MPKLVELSNKLDLKNYLNTCNTSRSGQFGEKLFEYLTEGMGVKIDPIHKEGADFIVEKIGRVDVKARVRLDESLGSSYSHVSKKIPKTSYCYVLFWKEMIEVQLIDDAKPSNNFNKLVSWDNAFDCWNTKIRYKKPAQAVHTEKVKSTQKELVAWVKANWGLRAKIIYRQGREAQEKMSKSGWGPESFFEKADSKNLPDIKILLYFDGPDVYEVNAYPISNLSNILWLDSPKGPNKKGIMTFKPHELDPIYRFETINQFKQDFSNRFGVVKE
jgi:hypothetical protein